MAPDRLNILHISPQPKEVAQRYARSNFNVTPTLVSSFRSAFERLDMETVFAEDGVPTVADVERDFHGVVVSGSVNSVYDAPECDHQLGLLLREMVERQNTALLGICYGQQLIAQACGGSVEEGTEGPEVGIVPISLTNYGRTDPLFAGISQLFHGHAVHKDTVMIPPYANGSLVRELARSKKYPNQAFAIGDMVRSVQFHPEILREDLETLLTLEPSPHVAPWPPQIDVRTGPAILGNFIRNIVMKDGAA